jgi:Cu(I)/Ag(I) efflux system membrane fusion protein
MALIAASAAAGWSLAHRFSSHEHRLIRQVSPEGEVYYTCPMHPQVRQPEPGDCPICGMKLIRKSGGSPQAAADGQRKVLYWYDPMRPDQHFEAPGKSPFMDMDLVPKYADEVDGDTVTIDPRMAQNLGVRTAKVERGVFRRREWAVGAVVVDERRIVSVETRTTGWVERLEIRAVGEPVERGQYIAGVYSPELLAAQEELVLAAQSGDAGLVEASRRRLALLGLGQGQIGAVMQKKQAQRLVSVLAPAAGIVQELGVREGSRIDPGVPLLRIADLSRVWISVEIPEAVSKEIGPGSAAEVRIPARPDRVFEGNVDYVYPRLESQTRTVRARITLENPDLVLKPGMFASVLLSGGDRTDVLSVPSEAVIRTGERSVVILAEGGGRFRPAQVTVGEDREGRTEILAGLAEGEDIVVSGQFLIDSEANLRGALARMEGDPPAGRMRQLGPEGARPVYGGHDQHRSGEKAQ